MSANSQNLLKTSKYFTSIMKLTTIKLTPLIIVAMGVVACAPKDQKMTAGGNTNVTQQSAPMSAVEHNKLLAVTLDQMTLPVVILNAFLNPQLAEKHGLIVEEAEISDDVSSKKITLIRSKETLIKKANQLFSFENAINYQVESLQRNEEGQLIELVLKSNDSIRLESKGVLKGAKRPTDFLSNNLTERINLTLQPKTNEWLVVMNKIEETNSFRDRQTFINSQIKFKFEKIEGTSNFQEVKIKAVKLNVSRRGAKSGGFTLVDKNAQLTIKLSEQCASLNGGLQQTRVVGRTKTDPGTEVTTHYELKDSSLNILEDQFLLPAQACESRPLVDWSKML